jgi:Transglutaminase-like superfamily
MFVRRIILFVLVLVGGAFSARGQSAVSYADIDRHALRTPERETGNLRDLAAWLTKPARSDTEKARAIYVWITQNIRYVDSTNAARRVSVENMRRQRAERVLVNRTALCVGYANLFKALAQEAGFHAEFIVGDTKDTDGSVSPRGHAWIAAKLDGAWHLIDPTWGATAHPDRPGYIVERYFMADPAVFASDHNPDDPLWQLSDRPVSKAAFTGEGRPVVPEDAPFSFRDSLARWEQLDAMGRLLDSGARILRFNPDDEEAAMKMGECFYLLQIDLQFLLDSLARGFILHKTPVDTARFLRDVARLEVLNDQAWRFFGRLRDDFYKDKTNAIFSPAYTLALQDKLKGDLFAGIFGQILEEEKPVTRLEQVERLTVPVRLAERHYMLALPFLEDQTLRNDWRNALNTMSYLHATLGFRTLHCAERLIGEARETQKMREAVESAVNCLRKAELEIEPLLGHPLEGPAYRERIASIRQALLSASTIGLRQKIEQTWEDWERLMYGRIKSLQRRTAALRDSLERLPLDKETDFKPQLNANLLSELANLYLNEGNLHYRWGFELYRQSYKAKTLETNKAGVLGHCKKGLSALENAQSNLNRLEKMPGSPTRQIAGLRAQAGKIAEALRRLKKDVE